MDVEMAVRALYMLGEAMSVRENTFSCTFKCYYFDSQTVPFCLFSLLFNALDNQVHITAFRMSVYKIVNEST